MNEPICPRVKVTFTKSSQKDGGVGHSIEVQEGASEREAWYVFDLAQNLHWEAMKSEEERRSSAFSRAFEASLEALRGDHGQSADEVAGHSAQKEGGRNARDNE